MAVDDLIRELDKSAQIEFKIHVPRQNGTAFKSDGKMGLGTGIERLGKILRKYEPELEITLVRNNGKGRKR